MSTAGVRCNGEVKQQALSSSDVLLTYRRRKRKRTSGESSYPREDVGLSADEEVYHVASSQGKGRDFGWEHGMMINGNRYHWKCKWCNFVGRSGGVTRLKKHLAGGWHVAPCAKVPRHISNTMNIHLHTLSGRRLFKRKRVREHDDIDVTNSECPRVDKSVGEGHGQVVLSMQVINGTEQFGRAVKNFETDSQQSRDSYPGSKFAIQQLNTDMVKVANFSEKSKGTARRQRIANGRPSAYRRSRAAVRHPTTDMDKAIKEPRDTMLYTDIYEQSDLSRQDCHWRSVLQHMLQSLDVSECDGIEGSINDALTYGPSGDNENCKVVNVPMAADEPKDRDKSHFEVPGHSREDSANTLMEETGTYDQTNAIANKQKCKEVFLNILCSEKFVSLCNILCENFQGIKVDKLFDISQMNSKMKNGAYGQSTELFNHDLQQMWKKFHKVGEEMVLLASSLSKMSPDIHRKQVGGDFVEDACPQKCQENCQDVVVAKNSSNSDTATQFPSCESVPSTIPDRTDACPQKCQNCQDVVVAKNSSDSDTATQFPSCESVPSTIPDRTEASGLYKVCTCKQCGTDADGEHSLICDECEAVYHFSCVEPAVQEIPSRSWYCTSCSKERTQSSEPPVKNTPEDSLHDNCVVCERLEFSDTKEHPNESGGTVMAIGYRESSISSMESDEPPEPSRTALSRLCKQCGTCEDEDKRFLICGHSQCPYKYYHIRCLTTTQIASPQQTGQPCWYCPSCLCRACFRDRDDDMIVLCDNCDEAYHTYCMKPPRTSIPKGQWYCLKCNVAKAKEGMRRYEQWILQQHGKKDVRQANEGSRSMDVLLSAVEKLSSEENLAAARKQE